MSGEISLLIKGNAGQLKKELAGASEAVKDFGNQSEKFLQKGAMSAKQMAFATRGLPAQFTDIATSLQAGQNPLTVFLQQGGQLKDMFGGIGPATKAMGGYLMGLINPYTVAAAAAAALGYAWYKGAAEAGEYNKALILSGNTAGATALQMQEQARAIAASSSASTGAAAEAVTQFVRNGNIASEKIQGFASTSVSMQQLTAAAVSDTVKQFAELGKSPVDASLKLNETTGYLTAGVYEQIKSLVDHGDTLEAGALAQQTWADAMNSRMPQLEDNLLRIEKWWHAISKSAKEAWSSMISASDPATMLRARLATLQGSDKYANGSYMGGQAVADEVAALQEKLRYYDHIAASNRDLAASQAAQNKQLAAGVALSKEADQYASKQVQMQRAIAKAQENFENSGKSAADLANYSQAVVGIQDKFKEAKKAKEAITDAAKGLALYNDLMAVSTGLSANFAEKQAQLAAKFGKDSNMDEYRAGLTALIAQQPYMVDSLKAEAAALDEIAKARDKALLTHANELESLGEKAQKIEDEVALYGMSKDAIEALTTARMLDRIEVLKGFDNSGEEIARIEQVIAARQRLASAATALDMKDVNAKAAADMLSEQKKAAEASGKYWEDALMRAFESGKGFFESLWDTIKNTLKTQVLKVLIQGVGIGSMGMSGAAMAGQGGTGGNLLGTAGSLSGLYDSITGGFTKVASGASSAFNTLATSSVGQSMGMSSAATIGNNASAYVAPQMTSGSLAASSAIGTAAGYAAGAAAGLAIGNAIAGEFGSSNTVTAGVIIGSIVGGPIGGAIGGAIGGLVNRAFGMGNTELTAQGTRGTFNNTGFSGTNYANYHKEGGWFRSDKNWTENSAVDPKTVKSWSDSFTGMQVAVANTASSLGLATEKIYTYSKAIDIAAGSTAEQVTALFTGMADDMATAAAPGIEALAKTGETSSVTLQRLSTSITTTNAWLSMLRNRLYDVSMAGADAASKLADAFGGLDNLAASSKAYYEAYYSEAERTTRSSQDLAKAMALVNVALPVSKDAFRAVVSSLDLTTEAGRNAYAVMLALAPEYAATSDAIARMAKETATQLMVTFTGNGQLVPALDAAALKTVLLGNTLTSTYAVAGNISTLFLDVNSGLLTFGAYTQTLTGGLNGTQLAAWSLNEQIDALHLGADKMRVDFVGLSAALATVDTETFMNTIALVFENLATRIQGVIGDITTERIAVREAALQIINPTVMGKAQIQTGIAGINTALPGNASSAASLSALANANAIKASADAALTAAKIAASAAESTMLSNQASYDAMVAVGNSNTASLAAAKAELARLQSWVNVAQDYGGEGDGGPGFISQRVGSDGQIAAANAAVAAAIAAPNGSIASALGVLSSAGAAMIAAQYGMASASAKVAAASAGQDSAVKAAAAAQLLYVAALQNFAIDASKSVGKLGKLREETVKYYEAQKQLADLMGGSAAGLRTTVADYRYSQLSDAQQFDKLQAEFAKNYAMGLSTDGETLAGYGDKLNAGLTPLLEKAREVLSGSAYNSFSATALARAETIAGRLESLTPTNYAADSLTMLGNIDATLAALDASSQSAEKIISDAINAGSDKTAAGLRAIVQQLGGSPAFATGGAHAGGGRWVGENGPEFEVTGPSHIYNAQQLRRLGGGSGGNADVVAELRALRQDNDNMRIELRALVSSNARMAKLAERAEIDGQLVRTDADTPLTTVVLA